MKRLTLMVILTASLNTSQILAQVKADSDISFYYSNNEKKEFSVIKNCIVIFPEMSHDGTDPIENLQKDYNFVVAGKTDQWDAFSSYYPHNDIIVQVPVMIDPESYDDTMVKLNADSRVRSVCNMIDSTNYLSRFIDIQLKEDIAAEKLYSFAKELNVNVFGPNEGWYTLETTTKSVGNSSYCAEKLYNSGLCQMVSQIAFGINSIDYTTSVSNLEGTFTSEFFNLQGQSVTAPVTPGVYIRRMSDGKVKKILVK